MNNTLSIGQFKLEHGAECSILNIKCIGRKTVEFLVGIQLWAQWFRGKEEGRVPMWGTLVENNDGRKQREDFCDWQAFF